MIEQSRYQVRLDWGQAGLASVGADADVVVWVDTVRDPYSTPDLACFPEQAAVLEADLRTSLAVARWISALQRHIGRRLTVAMIPAGDSRVDGSLRFAVEDHLAAGAIVGALATLGIDATSPEAAIAESAYRGLARAAAHLISAASTGEASSAQRVDPELGPEDVLVLRHHPEA